MKQECSYCFVCSQSLSCFSQQLLMRWRLRILQYSALNFHKFITHFRKLKDHHFSPIFKTSIRYYFTKFEMGKNVYGSFLIYIRKVLFWQVPNGVIRVFPKYFTEFAEFRDKNISLYFTKIIQTCHLLCKRPRYYYSASKTQVTERIFKLSPIHASVIYQIS